MVNPISDEKKKAIIDLYNDGTPVAKITEQLSLDKGTIYKYLRLEGVYKQDINHARKSSKRLSVDDREKLLKLYDEGMPVAEISEKLGIAIPSIYGHVRNAGKSRVTPKSTIQKAVDMYNSNQFSVQEVLDKTGVTRSTLYRNLKKK